MGNAPLTVVRHIGTLSPMLEERFWAKVHKTDNGCWLWTASNVRGYGQYRLNGKIRFAHRVSYAHHIGSIPDGHLVLHRCDTPACVNPDHLFTGTAQDNSDDKMSKGRDKKVIGVAHHNAKMTPETVRLARRMARAGMAGRSIADAFGVASSTMNAMLKGETWQHVVGESDALATHLPEAPK